MSRSVPRRRYQRPFDRSPHIRTSTWEDLLIWLTLLVFAAWFSAVMVGCSGTKPIATTTIDAPRPADRAQVLDQQVQKINESLKIIQDHALAAEVLTEATRISAYAGTLSSLSPLLRQDQEQILQLLASIDTLKGENAKIASESLQADRRFLLLIAIGGVVVAFCGLGGIFAGVPKVGIFAAIAGGGTAVTSYIMSTSLVATTAAMYWVTNSLMGLLVLSVAALLAVGGWRLWLFARATGDRAQSALHDRLDPDGAAAIAYARTLADTGSKAKAKLAANLQQAKPILKGFADAAAGRVGGIDDLDVDS